MEDRRYILSEKVMMVACWSETPSMYISASSDISNQRICESHPKGINRKSVFLIMSNVKLCGEEL